MIRALALLLAAAMAGCGAPALPIVPQAAPAAVRGKASLAYASYEWNVDDAVGRWRAGTLWQLLAAKHVNDLLAGFDDAQIAAYSSKAGAARFNAFIAQAAAHGVRVELLLGDPSWIVANGSPSLERIFKTLAPLHFAGVHLDLEPNEVHAKPFVAVLKALVSAMRAYVAASPWPVTLDLNWFYAGGAGDRGYCLTCGLQSAGVRRIALMTYIADPKTVQHVDFPILARYPAIAFSIAQSVEPPAVVPPHDSYWSDGFARFYAAMGDLDARFATRKNYAGIAVESMQYLETMKP